MPSEKEEQMRKRERYEPETFCGVDLATTDPPGVKAFYTALFGWETEPAEEEPTRKVGAWTP